jgi:CBS domain-containing protein
MAFLFGLAGFATGNFFLILIAIFVWMGASQEGQAVAVRTVLGRSRVGDAMIRTPQVLRPTDTLNRAVQLTLNTSQSDFPVVTGDDRVIGVITADDLVRAVMERPGAPISEVMRVDVPTLSADEPLMDAQQRFMEGRVRAVPVVDLDGRLTGLLTIADISEAYRLLSARSAAARAHAGTPGGGRTA